MIGYLARRVLQGAFVIVGVALIVFFVTRLISDPVRIMLPLGSTQEQYDTLRRALGLDQPLPLQFAGFLRDVVRLDFGESLSMRAPVTPIVLARVPPTAMLVGAALALAMVIGVPLGVGASLRPGRGLDRALTTASLVALSVPQFWLGAMMILLFAVTFRWFPTSGSAGWQSLVLPGLTLALPIAGRLAMVTRSVMIDQLQSAYVVTQRAKGMSEPHIVLRHALRNALVPILTLASWEAAYGLAGYAVIVETVFAYPGIGLLAINAIRDQDIVLLQGVVFVVALIVVVLNIVTDLIYTRIDPRLALD